MLASIFTFFVFTSAMVSSTRPPSSGLPEASVFTPYFAQRFFLSMALLSFGLALDVM